jgi:hypothetical protein
MKNDWGDNDYLGECEGNEFSSFCQNKIKS